MPTGFSQSNPHCVRHPHPAAVTPAVTLTLHRHLRDDFHLHQTLT